MSSIIERAHTTARYSERVTHGGTVYLAGQVPENADAPFAEQISSVFAQIDRLLAEARSSKSHILSAQIFLPRREDIAAMNAAWEQWMPAGCAPARATVCGVTLVNDKWLVEVCVIAAVA